jgi:hypothetical protein
MSDKGMGNGPAAGPIADAPDGTLRLDSTKAAEAIKAAAALVRRLRDDRFWRPADIVSSALRNNAANYIEWLHLRIRELEAQREWRPGITAPKDGTRFLGAYRDGGGWTHHESFYINDPASGVVGWFMQAPWQGEQTDRQPDYWQPLTSPAAPVAEGSREAALHPTPKPDDREGR